MAPMPEPLPRSAQLEQLPAPLLAALAPLVERAPAALFPRARRLYFDKYPLECHLQPGDALAETGSFRTYVLRETLHQAPEQEAAKLHELALVHWQMAEQPPRRALAQYLRNTWQLPFRLLSLDAGEGSWFREGGAWVRVTLPGADPAPAADDPDPTP